MYKHARKSRFYYRKDPNKSASYPGYDDHFHRVNLYNLVVMLIANKRLLVADFGSTRF